MENGLEDANRKLGNALSNVFSVLGQLMLEAILKGKTNAEQIAQSARGRAEVILAKNSNVFQFLEDARRTSSQVVLGRTRYKLSLSDCRDVSPGSRSTHETILSVGSG